MKTTAALSLSATDSLTKGMDCGKNDAMLDVAMLLIILYIPMESLSWSNAIDSIVDVGGVYKL